MLQGYFCSSWRRLVGHHGSHSCIDNRAVKFGVPVVKRKLPRVYKIMPYLIIVIILVSRPDSHRNIFTSVQQAYSLSVALDSGRGFIGFSIGWAVLFVVCGVQFYRYWTGHCGTKPLIFVCVGRRPVYNGSVPTFCSRQTFSRSLNFAQHQVRGCEQRSVRLFFNAAIT